MSTRFGDFKPLCSETPSYPWCNLFYHQLQSHSPSTLRGLSSPSSSAPVGIDPTCGIQRAGQNGSLGNIANVIVCGLSVFVVGALIFLVSRRKAAVGRIEFRIFLGLYALSLPFQILTTGSLLEQGSTALTVLTAIHAGIVAALFWMLVGNALISFQLVDDGTMASVVPFSILALAFFAATTYISLDVAFSFTAALGPSNPPDALASIPLFVLTSIWPGAATIIYFILMTYVVLRILNEIRPLWYYVLAFVLFVLSQLAWFLLGKVVCRGSSSRIDGSFIATILETASVGILYLAWRSITEESWDDPYMNDYPY
ncbi:hypothetical protein BDN71DRAFT_1489925 [Pleurotus eryngii]|uniref:Chitin synthase export chaperone n=1 Tax=Pleurotus eryngii TaxID=5323 RepID=A0A9P5ZS85_PLEER|nr:hypothetical protein BDN71DRAFT_1489925 [Pleurotus eryngii]